MKKEYVLRGIDCGNCAAKIERAVNQLEQVESATVNLIAQKLILETKSEDGIDTVSYTHLTLPTICSV